MHRESLVGGVVMAGGHDRGPRGRSWLWITVVVALLAGAGGFVGGMFIVSPRQLAADSAPPSPSLITAAVVSQQLSSTVVTRGTISAAQEVNVGYGGLVPSGGSAGPGGDGVLTAMPVKVGDTVSAGSLLAEVSGRPMILLPGSRVMYRDMTPGSSGPDVLQLNQALQGLGYLSGKVSDSFTTATQDGIKKLYAAVGYSVTTTDGGSGTDAQQVAAAQAAVTAAQTSLTDLLNDDTATSADVAAAQQAVTAAKSALAATQARIGVIAPQKEIVFVPDLPANVVSASSGVGFAVPSVIAQLTTTDLDVVAGVPSSQAGLLQVGTPADVQLPDGTDAPGQVAAIGAADASSSTQQVTVTTQAPLDFSLAGQDVKVTFTAAQTTGPVLAVPPGALSSDAAGKLWVIVVGEGQQLTQVEVTTGVQANGLVQVTPVSGVLNPGDLVLIGR